MILDTKKVVETLLFYIVSVIKICYTTDMNNTTEHHILIAGAGFAGLSVALELAKKRGQFGEPDTFKVTIIDRNDFQLFTPDLYEIAAAIHPATTAQDLKDAVCLDVRLALAQHHIEFMQAEICSADPKKQLVTVKKDGASITEDIPYDTLVLSLGSESFYFGIEGMKEHSVGLKSIEEAALIRNTVFDLVEKEGADHVIVCGGGPAGVELAAELTVSCREQMNKNEFTVTLVEGRDKVLSPFGERVANQAMKRLEQLGVQLKMNFLIAKAEEQNGQGCVISNEGEMVAGDLIVWTGGVKASHVLEKTGITLNKRGQVPVYESFQSTEFENVFALGDCAAVPKQTRGRDQEFCAQTAHEAVHQAPKAAYNVLVHASNSPKERMMKYRSTKLSDAAVIAMGGKRAIVKLPPNIVFTSYFGWIMRKLIDFQHFRAVLPFMHACSVWYKAVRTMNANDN